MKAIRRISSFQPSRACVAKKRFYTSGSCFEGQLPEKAKQELTNGLYFRRDSDRGHLDFGWLDTKHTFSFAPHYKNDQHRGFRKLRVINDDFVAPGQGFETHSHINMEILSYILDGALEHKDSMGNGTVIHRDEIQTMSAGRGVTHSEFNPSKTEKTHLLQIWVMPQKLSLQPSYQQIKVSLKERTDQLRQIACPVIDGAPVPAGMVGINQDVNIYASILTEQSKTQISYSVPRDRYTWIHCAQGDIAVQVDRSDQTCQQFTLSTGDGVGIDPATEIRIKRCAPDTPDVEFLLFDLA